MPSTSPMPPKNLAAVRISDRSTETQTQTGYPPIDRQRRLDAALAGPGTWVVVLRTDARSGPFSRAVLDEPRRVGCTPHAPWLKPNSPLPRGFIGEKALLCSTLRVEPAGIEPATSCLQRASDPDPLAIGCGFGP